MACCFGWFGIAGFVGLWCTLQYPLLCSGGVNNYYVVNTVRPDQQVSRVSRPGVAELFAIPSATIGFTSHAVLARFLWGYVW